MTHRSCLAGVTVGDGFSVAVAGVLNVSPESFYAGSVLISRDGLVRAAEAMARAGAAFLDVGAMSTAPYLAGRISEDEEADRLGSAVNLLMGKTGVPISADTSRSAPARAALESGAGIINDVTGLTGDPALAMIVARAGAGLIAMVSEAPGEVDSPSSGPGDPLGADPVDVVSTRLRETLDVARLAGISADAIVIDPGIGFFRRGGMPWHERDIAVLSGLERLRALERPICIGVSRKSFIGAVTGEGDPARRLPGSLAATTAAVLAGAHVIRTHDVAETIQAVRVAEAVRFHAGRRGPSR